MSKDDIVYVFTHLVENAVNYIQDENEGYECIYCNGVREVIYNNFAHEYDCPVIIAENGLEDIENEK